MSSQNLERVPGLWHDDGTVVLRAGNSVYRLFPGILASHSPVFRDLFAVPQPSTQDTYDGVPLIVMQDSARDITAFLKAIFTPQESYIYMPGHIQTTLPWDEMIGILQLSTKYQVDHLRYHSLRLFRTCTGDTTLAEFNSRRFAPTAVFSMEMLAIARQCNALWLLPTFYYMICTKMIPAGECFELETFAQAGVDITEERLILRGRTKLIQANNTKICAPLRRDCNYGDESCSLSKREIVLDCWIDEYPFRKMDWKGQLEGFVCADCFEQCKTEVEEAREEIWDSLPAIFNLPSWQELRQQRDVDLGYVPASHTAKTTQGGSG